MDTARLRRLADRLYIAPESLRPLDLYSMPLDSLAAHPYIGPYAAKGIDRLRRTLPEAEFTFQAILDSRILPPAQARRLALYFPVTDQPFTFQAILDSRILPPAQARRLALYFPVTDQP